MNAVEIEQAISDLAEQPFDPAQFPFAFLEAFGNKDVTLKKLRSGASNKSDTGGVLQVNHIHIKVAAPGQVSDTLAALRVSPATLNKRHKVHFLLATDGTEFEAEDLITGETVACAYADFPDHFGFFLPMAGITTVKQISENAFDIRATSRLNRLYVTLLTENPEWGTAIRRPDMNHFMSRLIFCFFAEDTDIFNGTGLFTATVAQMSDGENTHQVISEIFRAMNTPIKDRAAFGLPRWADAFPYVNGRLFSGSTEVPRFSKIARKYLLHIGNLDWRRINPDIFGSMIQAVADDDERSALGMHYTSVPNILKVLNPLFLDDLHAALDEAADNPRKLLNLRKRMSNIRVFDPACGSGNFLVIAYKEMRAIEAEINKRRGEADRETDIPLTNFRGIELRDFAAEIARLALIIAEFQCDVIYRGPKLARDTFLPLNALNWITCGNALRLDWLSICPPTGTGVKMASDDLFGTPLDQVEIDFENEGGETCICGNPPYVGSQWRTVEQQEEMKRVFSPHTKTYKDLDYVACWFMLASQFLSATKGRVAFVATKSICQGIQVAMLWPLLLRSGNGILFAHRPFQWSNLAKSNAGVTCVIVGLGKVDSSERRLFDGEQETRTKNIGPYLIPMPNIIVRKSSSPLNGLPATDYGNKPSDRGHLVMSRSEVIELISSSPEAATLVRKYVGSQEFTASTSRYCLWINDSQVALANSIPEIKERLERVHEVREFSTGLQSKTNADSPHRFVYAPHRDGMAMAWR